MFRIYFRLAFYLIALLGVSSARAGAYDDFFKAVQNDDVAVVLRLLQRGFDPNSRDEQGQVALFLSLREGSLRVAQVLMQSPDLQVDLPNAADETPLMIAALKGHTEWVRRLVERGAQVNRPGWAPLHYAATGAPPALAGWLLDHGAQIDARSPNGSTPLMLAARYGSEDCVLLLLRRGADPRLRNDRALDAADFARLAGRDALAQRLAASPR